MFSVNIDKLIKMTPLEAESYAKAADSLENLLADKGNMLAVVGSGMSSFKLAAAFMEKKNVYYLPMQILVRKFFWENISLAKI